MKLVPGRLVRASFVERPNRFLVRCFVVGRGHVKAQMPNPGRMTELLIPGVTLLISDDSAGSEFPSLKGGQGNRKTRFTVWAVESDGETIFLHTHHTNRVAAYLLQTALIPSLESAKVVRTEVPHGRSRFDFLMEELGERFVLEVKSVTLFGNGAAQFPDAVTERGRHHLLKLAELGDDAIRDGHPKPVVLFLAHSDRVNRFLPDYHTDLAFSETLLEVRDRIRILPVSVGWTRTLKLKNTVRELPVPWRFLKREVQDGGAYLLLLRNDKHRRIPVGGLGEVDFSPGWYVYVGSAMKGLTARIARHMRRRKRFHWHIDFLRDRADHAVALPIRSSRREECSIADALSEVLTPYSSGFGCSDCCCRTHLYFSAETPLHSRSFHEVLARFRMPESTLPMGGG